MRVALVTNWYWPRVGGLENAVSLLARSLDKLNQKVWVETRSDGRPKLDRDPNGIRVARRGSLPLLGILPTPSAADIVHVNGSDRFVIATASRLREGRAILTPHNGLFREPTATKHGVLKGIIDETWARRMLLAYRAIVALNEAEMDRYVAAGIARERLHVIPNAFDDRILTMSPCAERDKRRFVFLGRLSPEKGVELAIAACARAAVELELIGDGDRAYVATLRRQAEASGARIRFCGRLDGKEKFEHVASAAALIVSSPVEGQSLAILEAMALGTVVIASAKAAGGVVIPGQTGLFYERSAIDSLVALLHSFDPESAEARQIRDAAMSYVVEKHDPISVAERYIALYRSLS